MIGRSTLRPYKGFFSWIAEKLHESISMIDYHMGLFPHTQHHKSKTNLLQAGENSL